MFDPNFFTNQKSTTLKKHLSQIVGHKISEHEEVLDRIMPSLVTDDDIQKLANLIGDVYQSAYAKCVEDHRKELERLGIRSLIKSDQSSK